MENKQLKEHDINKIYFVPGNLVTIKHELPNKPVMLVTEIVNNKIIQNTTNPYWGSLGNATYSIASMQVKNTFLGIRCIWFTDDGIIQERVFSTKDLIKVEEGE